MADERLIIGAGFAWGWWGRLDTGGRLLGQSASLTAGDQDGSNMGRIHGVKNFPPNIPEPDKVDVSGDDNWMTSFIFPAVEGPGGLLTTAVQDMDFEANALGLTVYNMEDQALLAIGGPKDPTFNDLCFVFQRQAKSWTAGTRGVRRYEGVYIKKANCQPLFNEFAERTANPYGYFITMSRSDVFPWGYTMGTSEFGTEESAFDKFTADNPVTIQAWRGNAVQTVFNFAYRPAAATKCSVFIEGIKQTITTHYTVAPTAGVNGTITFVAAPGNNQLINVVYEMDVD